MAVDIEVGDWLEFNNGASVPRHVFALTDLHGMSSLAAPMLSHLAALPTLGERVLINCGDAFDRGPGGLEVIGLLQKQDEIFDEVQLLCGNHEIMAIDALFYLGVGKRPSENPTNLNFWLRCGGIAVYDEISPDGTLPYFHLAERLAPRMASYLKRVGARAAPHHVEGDLLFVHAGILPPPEMDKILALHPQDHVVDGQHWAWVRDQFLDCRTGWDNDKRIVVHGHTICLDASAGAICDVVQSIDRIATHRRINLDIGSSFFGHIAAMEAHGNRYRFHFCKAI